MQTRCLICYIDVWGPYNTPTNNGCKYFLTLVDDHSRAVWTILISTKQHVTHSLQEFYAYVQTQFNTHVKCIITDNGGEFLNAELSSFLAKNGVIHQTTCPYTPQQNGRVERKHRNLLEMTRALKFQSAVPNSFWGDCLLTATYLLNRIPSPVIGNISPYEVLYHEPPSYDTLKIFGCLAFMHQHSSDKLSPRAVPTVFLGYPLLQKGYKLYDIKSNTIHVSRHVVFHEHIFPFTTAVLPSESQSDGIFILLLIVYLILRIIHHSSLQTSLSILLIMMIWFQNMNLLQPVILLILLSF